MTVNALLTKLVSYNEFTMFIKKIWRIALSAAMENNNLIIFILGFFMFILGWQIWSADVCQGVSRHFEKRDIYFKHQNRKTCASSEDRKDAQ